MVEFSGDTIWRQAQQAEFTTDSYGVDSARVLWRGRSTLYESFQNSLKRWESMPGYPMMRLQGSTGQIITPSFPGVELNFIGFRDGSVPPDRHIGGRSLQSATASAIDRATGREVSGTFYYYASRTSYVWYEKQQPPEVCPKTEVLDKQDPLKSILWYEIIDSGTGTPRRVPYSAFVAVFNQLRRGIFVTDYSYEEVFPNDLWACRCDLDYKILQ